MNVRPAPTVPGKTELERFDTAVRTIFAISIEEVARREDEWKKVQGKEPAK